MTIENNTTETYWDKFHFTIAYQTNDNSFGIEDTNLSVQVQTDTEFETDYNKHFAYKKLLEEIQENEQTSGFKNTSNIYRGCVRQKVTNTTIVDPCVKSSLVSGV